MLTAMIYVDNSGPAQAARYNGGLDAAVREVDSFLQEFTHVRSQRPFELLGEALNVSQYESALPEQLHDPKIVVFITDTNAEDGQTRVLVEQMLNTLSERMLVAIVTITEPYEEAASLWLDYLKGHPRADHGLLDIVRRDRGELVAEVFSGKLTAFIERVDV